MKNKKSKKIMIVGAMAALLTLIGVTGSETYAKYIETQEVTAQQATVAKWGMVVKGNGSKLFADAYKVSADSQAVETTYTDANVVIKANTEGRYILAPGATGSITFGVSFTKTSLTRAEV